MYKQYRFNPLKKLGFFLGLVCCIAHSSSLLAFSVSSLTIDNGLKTNTVTEIVQDKEGFMWIGSMDGLSRYDGYYLSHFRHEPDNPHSLSNNFVTDLIVDNKGTLWIATFNGLNRFDERHSRFERYSYTQLSYSGGSKPRKSFLALGEKGIWFGHHRSLYRYRYETDALEAVNYSAFGKLLSDDVITALYEDNDGFVWIGFKLSGLMRYDPDSHELEKIELLPPSDDINPNMAYSDVVVQSLIQHPDGSIWAGTSKHGIFIVEGTQAVLHYIANPDDPNSLPHQQVNTLFVDDQGITWVGTSAGLAEKLKNRNQFFSYKFHPAKQRGLTNDNIQDIYQDRSGLIWIGTQTGGANIYNPATEFFHHKKISELDNPTLSNQVIRGMEEDHLGYIWIGTQDGGVNRLDINTDHYDHYRHDPTNIHTLPNDRVSAIYEDNDHDLWVTTLTGMAKYNRDKDRFEHAFSASEDPNALTIQQPISIMQSKDGLLWIGTRNKGLIRYNKETKKHTRYVHNRADPKSISFNGIRPLLEDSFGYIWVGTKNGLNRFDRTTETFSRYHHDPNDHNSLSHDYIYALHQDSQGRLWIGTGDGLNMFDRETETFLTYTREHGLPNNNIYGILEDEEKGHLWLSTNYGLSQFDLATRKFRNYDISHGLQSNEFNPPSALKTRAGMMFFGGINGFNFFHPRAIRNNPYKPKIIITKIDSIKSQRLPKNTPIHRVRELELEHTDQVISFQFAALDFTNSSRNKYRYKLEGFDHAWIDGGHKNFVTYTNLDPGHYRFKVEGSNSDGVWSENTAQLDIVVHPAPWATIWANIAYVTIFALLTLYYVHRHRKELAKEREVATKLREVSALKDQFLATTSHELRTPMNGVIGTASLLSETKLTNEQREYVDLIRISSENLLSIINDILDFSRIEAGKVDLENRHFSLSQLLEEVLDIFAVQAQKNGIELIYFADKDVPDQIFTDSTRLRQILINLIGNALKFTKKGEVIAAISIEKNLDTSLLRFEIKDTGIGIPENKMASLFEAFTQVDASTTRRFGGTGLGLAISRRLVELMGGTIEVESEVNRGTNFSFTVPFTDYKNDTFRNLSIQPHHFFKHQHVLLCHENQAVATLIAKKLEEWHLNVTIFDPQQQTLGDLDSINPNVLLINHNKRITETIKVQSLLQHFDNLPAIFISALSHEELMNIYELQVFEVKSPIKWQRLYAMCSALLQISDFSPQKSAKASKFTNNELARQFPAEILIAEDNPINQRIAHQMLIRLGYDSVDIVSNGKEALDAATDKHYDIILMDVQMPEMDGLNATKAIVKQRCNDKFQHIIAMTANAMEGDKEKCLAAGMDSYLPKPVKMSDLREQLRKVLSMRDRIRIIES